MLAPTSRIKHGPPAILTSDCIDRLPVHFYSVFHQFRQAKFDHGGSILNTSQFLLVPQLPQKMKLASKVVKIDSKQLAQKQRSKSVKLTVYSEYGLKKVL
jgi:hypothetical protein